MTDFNRPTPEDEAFNDIARMSKIKQEIVRRQMEPPKTQQQFYDELRNGVIDEVTVEIQKMQGFGKDTLDSLCVYIQGMKK
jgi:hypothetical protein